MRSSRVARVVIGSDLKSDGYGRASSNLVSDVPIFFFLGCQPSEKRYSNDEPHFDSILSNGDSFPSII